MNHSCFVAGLVSLFRLILLISSQSCLFQAMVYQLLTENRFEVTIICTSVEFEHVVCVWKVPFEFGFLVQVLLKMLEF